MVNREMDRLRTLITRRAGPIAIAMAAAVVGAAGPSVLAQEMPFARESYQSAGHPRAIARADFNGDGWIDIASAGTERDSVLILLNGGRGAPGFRRGSEVTVGGGPFDMAAGDLNRDGIADLAIANADLGAVTLLIGRGDGTFAPKRDIAIGGNPRGVALADVDRDGKLDVLVTQYAGSTWRVLYGDGRGRIARSTTVATSAQPQGIVVADFNRDGRTDVAVVHASAHPLSIFYRTSAGSWTRRIVGSVARLNVLTSGDFNRDGWIDLAASSTTRNSVTVYQGGASGVAVAATYPVGTSPRGIDAGDLNQDGMLDLVTANRASSTISVLMGLPSAPGTFAPRVDLPAGLGARDVVLADVNHDGRVDAASADEQGSTVSVVLNRARFARAAYAFSFADAPWIGAGRETLAVADFDRNGRVDIVTADLFSSLYEPRPLEVWFDGNRRVEIGSGQWQAAVSGDFNGDGRPDIVVTDPFARTLRLYRGDGRGGFTPRDIANSSDVREMVPVDANRDGRLDLVVAAYEEPRVTVSVLLGDGRGELTAAAGGATVAEGTMVGWGQMLTVADINQDNVPDAAVRHSWGFTVLLGSGSGTWAQVREIGGAVAAEALAFGDFNEDGIVDAVTDTFVGSDAMHVAVFVGRGDGTFDEPMIHEGGPVDTSIVALATSDMNVDGHLDVVANSGDVWFGRGDGSFSFARFVYLGRPTIVDYDRDGLLDVLSSRIILNRRTSKNRVPIANAGPDFSIAYEEQGFCYSPTVDASRSSDPDLHGLRYEWRDAAERLVSTSLRGAGWLPPGRNVLTLTAFDNRGGRASDSVAVTVTPYKEIVMHAGSWYVHSRGNWVAVEDRTAASGVRAHHPDTGAAKVATPVSDPPHALEMYVPVDPTQQYKLWIRGKAQRSSGSNDSVFVQFDGATDVAGRPVYQIGSTSALTVNFEECSGCGLAGWSWEDDGWGAKNRNGGLLRFPRGGYVRILVQTREDGVSIDQIVLSAEKYLTRRPGLAKNDNTILPETYPVELDDCQ